MLTLAKRYASKPPAQWPPLFHRILQNRIRDYHRRGKVSNRLFARWFGTKDVHGEDTWLDPVDLASGPEALEPQKLREMDGAVQELDDAVAELPPRQREAFLLRVWEGFDVAQTAAAMGVSAGSVKTHYSRAVHALRNKLEAHWRE